MPMGALNSAAKFVAMMAELQKEWDAKAQKLGIKHCGCKVIINDILVHGCNPDNLIKYFDVVLDTLKYYRATIKLKKCSWF